jgi:hypothetical protein
MNQALPMCSNQRGTDDTIFIYYLATRENILLSITHCQLIIHHVHLYDFYL